MSNAPKATKKQLLKLIDELEKSPGDKVRILGDVGITIVGAGLGAAAATTIAAAAGATSIVGVTTAASWLGLTVVSATPVGWIAGGAVAAAGVAYSVSRLIRSASISEGRKAELLLIYRENAKKLSEKEAAGTITDEDRTRFHFSLRELIEKNVISPEIAFRLMEQVENGRVSIPHAFSLLQSVLEEPSAKDEVKK